MTARDEGESLPYGFEEIAALIRHQEVGRGTRIRTPFGERLISYADLTATGRYLRCVAQWIDRYQQLH